MIIHDALRLEYAYLLYILVPLVLIAAVYRLFFYRSVTYRYSLAHYVVQHNGKASSLFKIVFFTLRVIIMLLLVFLIAKPQLPDRRTEVTVDGIDIILTLDVSGSMACLDDLNDRRSRMTIAKQEALRFIEQRTTDALGLVVFANGVLSACPLTHDKAVLREIIDQLNIGTMVDDRSTLLAHGLLAALNRLKISQSPSKVIILLTDGQPSVNDVPIQVPITIARQLGVKIYTIGVGNERGGFFPGPQGFMLAEGVQLNEQLLENVAKQTGGVFYRARNAHEMREIYQTIDALEKRSMNVPLYTRYYDIFEPVLWIVLLLCALELGLALFVWRYL